MKRMRFIKTVLVLFLYHPLAISQPFHDASVKAPQLRNCSVTARTDLGVWDDVFVFHDQDQILLRREGTLFSLSMVTPSLLSRLITVAETKGTEIAFATHSHGRLWLFLQSSEAAPFAIDAHSGSMCQFSIPGLKLPGDHTPGIQSYVLVPHADAAILMIAGGDRQTWPRDGNRPVYFWMDLKVGKVVPFPVGWDLEYFSSDQTVAVFGKPLERASERRPLQAVDVKTGTAIDEIPDRRKQATIPFNWTETQEVKPLTMRRAETGDRDHFAGLSLNGSVLPLDIGLAGTHYLSEAKTKDGFAGFRLRREGSTSGEPSSLWFVPLKQLEKLECVEGGVTDFAILANGNCVLIRSRGESASASSEASFYSFRNRARWNVLDDVERLPPLDKEFAGKDYLEDKTTFRLIDGFGSLEHGSLILCVCSHFRGEMRAYVNLLQGKRLEPITWRRALLLTSIGERYMTDLFREGNLPDQIWLHNSGKMILGKYRWQSSSSARERKIELNEITMGIPRDQTVADKTAAQMRNRQVK